MARRKSVLSSVADEVVGEEVEGSVAPQENSFRRRMSLVGDISSGRVDAKRTRFVEPEKCGLWEHHNRLHHLLTPENCADLISSIESRGEQTVSAIVRPAKDITDGIEYEIIAGARRHFSVSHLRNEKGRDDILYRIEVHDLSDEDAFLISDAENRDREDLSDYERALDYQKALEAYYSGEVRAMARKLSVKESWLHKYLHLAKLPDEIVALAPDVREWRRDHASKLVGFLSKPKEWSKIEKEAESIRALQDGGERVANHKPLSANEITKRLVMAASTKGRGGAVQTQSLALGEFGGAKATVTSRKVTIDIPRKKGMDVEALLARIESEFAELSDPTTGT